MKTVHTLGWLTAGLLLMGLPASATADTNPPADERVVVEVENPLAMVRRDEVVSLSWPALQARLAALTADAVRVRVASGAEVPSQVVDTDADGQVDALLFLASLWPNETRQYYVEAAAPTAPHAPRVYAMHDEERDDLAWENDRVAFRTYGKGLWEASAYDPLVSSGIDVWLKRVQGLIVAPWYAKGHDAYHLDTGEGADFFTVGPTLGAGGTAVWRDGQMYRSPNFSGYRIIANGPIRAIFELDYEPWDAGGIAVSETKRFTIDAGHHLFRQESTFRTDAADAIEYVVGLVKREGAVGTTNQARSWAWLSLWGPVERNNGGHGKLGTAVLIHQNHLVEMRETDDHYVAVATAPSGEAVVHYLGDGWTASSDFDGVEAWWAYLDTFARKLEAPLSVTIIAEGE